MCIVSCFTYCLLSYNNWHPDIQLPELLLQVVSISSRRASLRLWSVTVHQPKILKLSLLRTQLLDENYQLGVCSSPYFGSSRWANEHLFPVSCNIPQSSLLSELNSVNELWNNRSSSYWKSTMLFSLTVL